MRFVWAFYVHFKDNAVQYKEWADTIVSNLSKNYRAALNGWSWFPFYFYSTGSAPHQSEIDVPIVYATIISLRLYSENQNWKKKETLYCKAIVNIEKENTIVGFIS